MNAKDLLQYVPNNTLLQLQFLDLAAQASVAVFERDGSPGGDNGPLDATISMLEAKFSNLKMNWVDFKVALLLVAVDV